MSKTKSITILFLIKSIRESCLKYIVFLFLLQNIKIDFINGFSSISSCTINDSFNAPFLRSVHPGLM